MIDISSFRDTIALYNKHGWELTRLLLAGEPSDELLAIIGEVPVQQWKLDAAWFTRVSKPNTTTWELRYLGTSPIALVSVVTDDTDLEQELTFQQEKLLEMMSRKRTSEPAKNGTS
ncbi:MAG: hypothetical protein DYH05_04660 [Acidobacteria bacterium ACB1]|nr:hypothetical protein [Pyrinomonadaceae bacterium]MCE7961774.1 hypothetical protein [Acidobacteria bacterium ACB1]RIJ94326.1 MAG: hypothetical protein DCC44_04830 [Acidobacteriota bacterium]